MKGTLPDWSRSSYKNLVSRALLPNENISDNHAVRQSCEGLAKRKTESLAVTENGPFIGQQVTSLPIFKNSRVFFPETEKHRGGVGWQCNEYPGGIYFVYWIHIYKLEMK